MVFETHTVTHNLNTTHVVVSIRDTGSDEQVEVDVDSFGANDFDITAKFTNSTEYEITVIG